MAFLDGIRIRIAAGSGGHGSASFRREKYAPRGGPDGGDGGRGGDVVLRTTTCVQDLSHLAGVPLFKADDGGSGMSAKCHGKNGGDLIMNVPAGTIVSDATTGLVLRDLDEIDADLVVARGGKGGRGNVHFATATNQAPLTAERGEPGEARELQLELKLIADVGLVGLPNAGKSTLLSKISQAHPKIAPYPFTTLYPQLGVTEVDYYGRMVVADIPGLIEGAHRGVGLGDEFLRHIERTRCLVHVIDASAPDPVKDYGTLRAELESYGHGVAAKKRLVVANKIDLTAAAAGVEALEGALDDEVVVVSAATGQGIEHFLERLSALASAAGA